MRMLARVIVEFKILQRKSKRKKTESVMAEGSLKGEDKTMDRATTYICGATACVS
jgi:hypothetical protein